MWAHRSSPIRDPRHSERPPATCIARKRDIILNTLLVNSTIAGDIPIDAPSVSSRSINFPPVTSQEIQDSLLRAKNTPGADGIMSSILRHSWPIIEIYIYSLFLCCIAIGHHPKCFRQSILILLQKPKKPDLSSPRSYRPIALLSVLGKGLERNIAKRLSGISIREIIIAYQQFGALPLRSAIDLTMCITLDIERALSDGRPASMLTLDVKGTFDSLLSGRLIRRLGK